MAQPSTNYPLARTHLASARLNLQHYNTKQAQGFLLHPSIQFNSDSPVIADVGTGTGIWLLDLAESVPAGARLYGFDIDLSQTPPVEWLPENVFMEQLDVYGQIPDDLLGKFDLIHVKAFICVVRDGEPMPVITSLARMLKPGGYIQWTELDVDTVRVESIAPPASLPGTSRLCKVAKSPTPNWPESIQRWPQDLPKFFQQAGLSPLAEHRFKRKTWQRPFFHDVTLLAMQEMSVKAPDPNTIQDIINQSIQESQANRRGVDIDFTFMTMVGQKPFK